MTDRDKKDRTNWRTDMKVRCENDRQQESHIKSLSRDIFTDIFTDIYRYIYRYMYRYIYRYLQIYIQMFTDIFTDIYRYLQIFTDIYRYLQIFTDIFPDVTCSSTSPASSGRCTGRWDPSLGAAHWPHADLTLTTLTDLQTILLTSSWSSPAW